MSDTLTDARLAELEAEVQRLREDRTKLLQVVGTYIDLRNNHPQIAGEGWRDLIGTYEEMLDPEAEQKWGWPATAQRLQAEIARLRDLLNFDRSSLAAALVKARTTARGWGWIPAGEWGSYEYHDQTETELRREVGDLIDAVDKVTTEALRVSGDNAIAAAQPDTVRSLREENERLRTQLTAFADRIASQSDALSRVAERDATARLETWATASEDRTYDISRNRVQIVDGPHVVQADCRYNADAAWAEWIVFVGTKERNATSAECILAALDLWSKLYGTA